MDCIVLDDESVSREIITFLCKKEPNLQVKGSFPTAIEAFKFLNTTKVDLIFLDIHMPDFSGFEFIQTLKSPPMIIITSSDIEQATEVFEYDSIIDFIKKPVSPERFQKAIQKAQRLFQGNATKKTSVSTSPTTEEHLYINIDKKLIHIETRKISLIQAQGDYVDIQGDNLSYKVHTTLSNILEKLPENTFLQVHRSYVINLNKIIDIQDNTILIDKSVIPISRSKRTLLMQKLNRI